MAIDKEQNLPPTREKKNPTLGRKADHLEDPITKEITSIWASPLARIKRQAIYNRFSKNSNNTL